MNHLLPLLIPFLLLWQLPLRTTQSTSRPMNCTDTGRICRAYLAFKPSKDQTFQVVQSMFDVLPQDLTVEGGSSEYVFVRKNCSCLYDDRVYATNSTYTVKSNGGFVNDVVLGAYDGLALLPSNVTSRRAARAGAVVSVRLLCGCSSGLWNYLMSYVMEEGDSVESLSSRFGVSMASIEGVNGINSPDNITVGSVYYIPLNKDPGEPYSVESDIPPVIAPSSSDAAVNSTASGNPEKKKGHVSYAWIILGLGIVLVVIVLFIVICACFKCSSCCSKDEESRAANTGGKVSHSFQILRKPSFCCGSARYTGANSEEWKQSNGETSNHHHHITIPRGLATDVFDMEKPVVFSYEEIHFATDGFSDTNLLGHGTFGSVYHGHIPDQEVAIKRMTATKTKEFLAEMKVLCKVHHANLVELIGYAATDDELFLVYEYAQKGSLRSHLHDPQNKGQTSLSWTMRLQIALDAARGLEYIHEHTKTHYVHRDVKSSNILLDGSFRAKISDFGLAKLVGRAGEGEATVTKVVGTFGYLAPEYLSDGLATSKSDVYAFGVVLFELISGKEAVIRSEGAASKNPDRRSLASTMLAALRSSPESMTIASLKDHIDPNMMDLYPHDCLFKAVMVAKHCVEDDPILRPDMKQVVISLSQILLSSIEWEATLAGNSQVFSGLVQGR
ncbi:LysM domain receptor-like kinase 3 [Linum grandiflorum]